MVNQRTLKKGYKFRIYPTEEQKTLFNKTFGCCRFVWNRLLEDNLKEYQHYIQNKDAVPTLARPNPTGFNLSAKVAIIKAIPEFSFLNEVSGIALQQTALHLGDAFSNWFKKRKGKPSFKSRYKNQSFTILGKASIRLNNKMLLIPKSKEPLKVNWTRDLPSFPTSYAISKSPTGKFYISFICDYIPDRKTVENNNVLGIDLGIKDFVITHTGSTIDNPRFYVKKQQRLARYQRAMSRKKKGSKNREKARLKVARLHEQIADARNNFLHQLSADFIKHNRIIGLETLKPKNMLKNRKLSKHISDASWSSFVSQLKYKVRETKNNLLVLMDPFYPSSKLCHICDTKNTTLKLSDRKWTCTHCGTTHDRDHNAAINIQRETQWVIHECKLEDLPVNEHKFIIQACNRY